MLILKEYEIKNIISTIIQAYLTENPQNEINVKDVTKRMGWKPPKQDPFKKKKLTHVNMHAPGLMGEWRGDKRIPFEGEYGKKANYDHFIDYLENIGKYGELSGSGNAQKLYENALHDGFIELKDNHPMWESDMDWFLEDYNPEDYPDYYEEDTHDLTEDGEQAWEDFLWGLYQDRVDVTYQLNQRNLVYIYRAISIPALTSTQYNANENEDFYEELNRRFNGIGMCWSYEVGGAIPHSGGAGTTIIVYGLISPDNIDWVRTCALNGSGMDEREIRTQKNIPIEIYQMMTENGKKLPLKKSIIVGSGDDY